MSAQVQQSMSTVIAENDLSAGIKTIQGFDPVRSWTRRGKPVDDIEMEVKNVIGFADRRPDYRSRVRSMCDKYDITEPELIGLLLHGMVR